MPQKFFGKISDAWNYIYHLDAFLYSDDKSENYKLAFRLLYELENNSKLSSKNLSTLAHLIETIYSLDQQSVKHED